MIKATHEQTQTIVEIARQASLVQVLARVGHFDRDELVKLARTAEYLDGHTRIVTLTDDIIELAKLVGIGEVTATVFEEAVDNGALDIINS